MAKTKLTKNGTVQKKLIGLADQFFLDRPVLC